MKTYLNIIAFMLALNLVSGQVRAHGRHIEIRILFINLSYIQDGEGEDEQVMDISETYKCYVYGQCQVSAIKIQHIRCCGTNPSISTLS